MPTVHIALQQSTLVFSQHYTEFPLLHINKIAVNKSTSSFHHQNTNVAKLAL